MPLPKEDIFTEAEWTQLFDGMRLSPRQREVVCRIFHGMADQQIAHQLGIALSTVRMHISRLFSKLDVSSRHELTLLVFHRFRRDCRSAGCPRQR